MNLYSHSLSDFTWKQFLTAQKWFERGSDLVMGDAVMAAAQGGDADTRVSALRRERRDRLRLERYFS